MKDIVQYLDLPQRLVAKKCIIEKDGRVKVICSISKDWLLFVENKIKEQKSINMYYFEEDFGFLKKSGAKINIEPWMQEELLKEEKYINFAFLTLSVCANPIQEVVDALAIKDIIE